MNFNINILSFIHILENIKNIMRHSWTSKKRQESVADHSWRTALMVILCYKQLSREFDMEKALIMAIIHDIGEALIGDEHFFNINKSKDYKDKRLLLEREAVYQLTLQLGNPGQLIFNYWEEFAENISYESKIVNALDKLEVCIQHNEADISTWDDQEIKNTIPFLNNIEDVDNFISQLKKNIIKETSAKIKKEQN